MTERIDHAAKAMEWLTPAEGTGLTWTETSGMAAIAQAHATLALVEQQRIANLIALARVESENHTTPTDALDALYTREETSFDTKLHTRAEIREGLGLA